MRRKTASKRGSAENSTDGTSGAFVDLDMKLGVACLARTDMTPRPAGVAHAAPTAAPIRPGTRPALDSIFDGEDEVPTTLKPARTSRARSRAAAVV